MTTTVRAGSPAQFFNLDPGQTLTVAAGATDAGTVYTYDDAIGSQNIATREIAASSTVMFGPFAGPVRLSVSATAGAVTADIGVLSRDNPGLEPAYVARDAGGSLVSVGDAAGNAAPGGEGGGTPADGSITMAKLADLAQASVIGRAAGAGTGVPGALTAAQLKTILALAISDIASLQAALDAKAALASPTLTGTPAAPTAEPGTNTTQLANTAFVQAALAALLDSAPGTLDTLNELAAALGDDPNFAATIAASLAAQQAEIDTKLGAGAATPVTDTKAVPIGADKIFIGDSADSSELKESTVNGSRTTPPGTGLGTTGTVNLDFAADVGVPQNITLTGNITFTTSNLVAGRGKTLRLTGGGSTYTVTYPAGWKAFGAALPASLTAGQVVLIGLFANSTTDASVDAAAVLGV